MAHDGPDTRSQVVELSIPGGTLVADIEGDPGGRPIVLLHGFPQTRYTWRHQLPALARRSFRAIAPDQRGYSPGMRPAATDAYHVDHLVADVVAVAGSVGNDAGIDVVGHDWGGQVAWLVAARRPDIVRSLTVLSRPHPAAFAASFARDPSQAERSKHHRRFDDPATADLLLADDARRLRRMLETNRVPDTDIDGYLRVLSDRSAMEAALNWYRAARSGGLGAADTGAVRVPTLYLWGTDDHSVGRVAAETTADHVDAPYRFVEIPGGGHFLTDDGSAETVTAALLNHLDET